MVEIVGVKRSEGKSRDGRPYSGYRVWFTESQEGVQGLVTGDVYLSDTILNGKIPLVGETCVLNYRPGYDGKAYLHDVTFY